MNRRGLIVAAAASLALAGCGLATANKEGEAMARALYEEIRTGADLSADANLSDGLRTPEALAHLAAVRTRLPEGPPLRVETRSWKVNTGTSGGSAELIHAYVYPDRVVLAQTVLLKPPGAKTWRIAGFHVRTEARRAIDTAPGAGKPIET